MRTFTPPERGPDRSVTIWVKRCCNTCGWEIGDVTIDEIDAATAGAPLPDVSDECPHCAAIAVLHEIRGEQEEFEADLAYLQGYGAALIEQAGHRLSYPAPSSQWDQHIEETSVSLGAVAAVMSPHARADMLWPVV